MVVILGEIDLNIAARCQITPQPSAPELADEISSIIAPLLAQGSSSSLQSSSADQWDSEQVSMAVARLMPTSTDREEDDLRRAQSIDALARLAAVLYPREHNSKSVCMRATFYATAQF